MRFSIRSLLAIMLLCGVVFPLVIGLRQIRSREAFKAQLINEIKTKRATLGLDNPDRRQFREHRREELATLHETSMRAQKHFAGLQEKYGSVQPRGPDVLSLRVIPQLSFDDRQPPLVYRMIIPSQRPVWLKYALVDSDGGSQSSRQLDTIKSSPAKSFFAHRGPYEVRLKPGERVLRIETGVVNGYRLPITVRLDDALLMESQFESDRKPTTGAFYLAARSQIDLGPKHMMPWLSNIKVRLQNENGTRENAPSVGCFWLSDRSSDYPAFPQRVGE